MVELFWDPLAELDADPIVAFGHRGADTMRSWIGDECSGTSIVRLIAQSSRGRTSDLLALRLRRVAVVDGQGVASRVDEDRLVADAAVHGL